MPLNSYFPEDMPEYIDNFYDDLEEHASALKRLSSIKPSDARWLARVVKRNLDTEHERIPAEIEKELLVSTLSVFSGAIAHSRTVTGCMSPSERQESPNFGGKGCPYRPSPRESGSSPHGVGSRKA